MTAGERLEEAIRAELEENDLVLDAKEEELLRKAVETADLIETLEAAIKEHGVTVVRHQQGLVVNPLVTEVRMQRGLLQRLLAGIDLGGEDTTSHSARGRKGARAKHAGRSPYHG